jgi:hypothetical protein
MQSRAHHFEPVTTRPVYGRNVDDVAQIVLWNRVICNVGYDLIGLVLG